MVTPPPTVSCLFTLALLLSHTAVNAAALDTTLDPLPPVQHPALIAELQSNQPLIHDLGYLRVEAEPCLPASPTANTTGSLPALSHPLTEAESTLLQQYWRQLQHRQPEPAQGPLLLCYYALP